MICACGPDHDPEECAQELSKQLVAARAEIDDYEEIQRSLIEVINDQGTRMVSVLEDTSTMIDTLTVIGVVDYLPNSIDRSRLSDIAYPFRPPSDRSHRRGTSFRNAILSCSVLASHARLRNSCGSSRWS